MFLLQTKYLKYKQNKEIAVKNVKMRKCSKLARIFIDFSQCQCLSVSFIAPYTISNKRGLHRLYRQCMQIILRPENIYVSEALARAIVSFMYAIFFFCRYSLGSCPPYQKAGYATVRGQRHDPPPPPRMDSPRNKPK